MNKRELRAAFVKAMKKIKAQPHRYNFCNAMIPRRERGRCTGCVLAWIAFYAGQKRGLFFNANPLLPRLTRWEHNVLDADMVFYRRMDRLGKTTTDWRDDATQAAKALDRYIKKYLAPNRKAA